MATFVRSVLQVAAFALMLAGAAAAAEAGSGYAQRPEVREFVATLAGQDGFDRAKLLQLFSQVKAQEATLRLMTKPYVAPPKWYEYYPPLLSQARIDAGVAYWNANRAALERAEREYGVPPEVVVAIVGIETFYGRIAGNFRVIDALTTLAFDYPRRADFFKEELRQFLLFTRERRIPPLSPKGSFAGAMGLPQFMPTSFRKFAVDFDNDGKVDIWTDNADVIGSVANFLQRHGWERGGPVLHAAEVDPASAPGLVGDNGLSVTREYGEWGTLGVTARTQAAIDPRASALLVQLDESDGPAYRLGFTNFLALRQYNRSRLYATAVWELAQSVRKARDAQ
jgi:membrane-bound lytic murein transglycosylase B